MPVSLEAIKADLAAVREQLANVESIEEANSILDDGMAQAIFNAVLSATITVPAGIPVATTGSPAAQVGTTTSAAVATVT